MKEFKIKNWKINLINYWKRADKYVWIEIGLLPIFRFNLNLRFFRFSWFGFYISIESKKINKLTDYSEPK